MIIKKMLYKEIICIIPARKGSKGIPNKNIKKIKNKPLIQFSIDIITLCKESNKSFASDHLIKQVIRSATSSALNYGEAQSAESTKDFQHKMKLCLKELRETLGDLEYEQWRDAIEKEVRDKYN